MKTPNTASPAKKKGVSYAKWGYIFLLPFFIVFIIFQLIPLGSTIYYSFFKYFRSGLMIVGPIFSGFDNYVSLFKSDMLNYMGNTLLIWVIGFIPQLFFSLLLAAWFTNARLNLHGLRFFKTVIYLPNLIMASAFAMLFFALFSDIGPVNGTLMGLGITHAPIRFLATSGGVRGLVAFMNFLMWFGNTTILLMAAILGIDPCLYEAAEIDGASSNQMFWKITMPLIRPIMAYVLITSLIGGLQMFDVPQVLTDGAGAPDNCATTMLMFLNNNMYSKNYGMAGAISTVLFILCGILCLIIYRGMANTNETVEKVHKRRHA